MMKTGEINLSLNGKIMHRRKKYGQQFSGGVTIISVLLIVLAMCAVARGGITVTRKKLVVCVGEEGTAELVTTIPDDPRTKEEKQGQRDEPTIEWKIAEDDGTDAQVTENGDSADFSVESDDPGYYDIVVEVTISWPCAPGTGSVPDTVYSTTLMLTAIGIKDPLQYKRHWYVSSEDVTGTIYMALGGTVYFKANPDPDSADFPDGRPEWYVARGSEAAVEQETTGQRYTFSKDADGNPWTAGTYTIRAACGESSRSATVVVVEIARITCANQAGTVVKRSEATTDSEIGDDQTVFAPPNTTVTLTAVPDPACDDTEWLGDNLSWLCPALLINEAEQPDAPDQWAFKSDTVGDYVVTAKLGTSERKMQISVVTPKVFSVQFEGDIPIHHDVTGAAYSGVDWQDDDLDGTAEATEMPDANADDSKHYHPIAYQSRATLAIDAGNLLFQLDRGDAASRIPYDIVGVAQVKFCPDTFWYDLSGDWSTPGELDTSGVNISNSARLTAASPFEDHNVVRYNGKFQLIHKVGFGDAADDLHWSDAGRTTSELHLTWNCTDASFETVFYIGCKRARNKRKAKQIVKSIWREFTDQSVCRKGSTTPMTYWGSAATHPSYGTQGTAQLLRLSGGRCGDWAPFFIDLMARQGITVSSRSINKSYSGYGFLVKNWDFPKHPSGGSTDYPHGPGTYTDEDGVDGQGNSNPRAYFWTHALAEYGGTIYDPSYGMTAHDWTRYRIKALDGWFEKTPWSLIPNPPRCNASDNISLHTLP